MSVYGNAYMNGGFPPGYPSPYAGYIPPPYMPPVSTVPPMTPMQNNGMQQNTQGPGQGPGQAQSGAQNVTNLQTGQMYQQTPQSQQASWPTQSQQQILYPQGIPWVATRTDAENYNPPPGPVTALWVQNENLIYLKTLDNLGKPYTQILRYTDITERVNDTRENTSKGGPELSSGHRERDDTTDRDADYAFRRDVDALRGNVDALHGDLNNLREKVQPILDIMEEQRKQSRRSSVSTSSIHADPASTTSLQSGPASTASVTSNRGKVEEYSGV